MSKFPLILAITAAVIALGFFVFVTDAPAYGGSAPETCANCQFSIVFCMVMISSEKQ